MTTQQESKADRIKQSERVDIIIDYLKGKQREGFKVIELKDKDGNERYMVRRIKPNRNEREVLESKIARLQSKLDKLNRTKDDVPSVKQSK